MKTISTLIIYFACTIAVCAQTDKQVIADIKKAAKDIKAQLSIFQKIEKMNNKDGQRLVFLKDKELKLITVKALQSNMEKNVEWYYLKGQLAYSETSWYDTKTKTLVFNEKYFLDKGHLIAWLDSNNTFVDTSSAAFKKVNTELVAYGEKIKQEAVK